ncbi:globin domain-containing protein [Bosea sp. LjRoot90]|uniref:globin domain-containing protein n=1 Tax=Bosea sp. LjRoot90 TaxID=3342342 RepID=UPI003ECC350D
MTPQDIALVRSSFAQLHRRKIETACLFYERLFTTAPSTRALFKTDDIQAQAAKLMETLMVALAMLNDPGGLNVLLARLGERHRTYGVRPEHYEAVGSALLWTLETSLGADFTTQTRAAWTELYGQMAKTMLAAETPSRRSA